MYALDDHRILRTYKGDQQHSGHLEKLSAFYTELPKQFSFACPVIYEIGEIQGVAYSVENRIPGQDMEVVLPQLTSEQRSRALANYLHAVAELQSVVYAGCPYGELLARHPIHASSWRTFLRASVQAALDRNRERLAQDVQDLGSVVDAALQALAEIEEPAKTLVHGDYFPKNVMMTSDLRVSGVIDFSPMTVVGDPLMDIAGSLIFLEVLDCFEPTDSAALSGMIENEYGEGIGQIIASYRLYYSFYFCGAWRYAERLYRWCVNNLNNARQVIGR